MSGAARLIVDVRSYWHPGGGRGGGMVHDAAAHRDAGGLPVLPGRHLKGLLRDALERAAAYGWAGFDEGVASALFGERGEGEAGTPRPGSLRVGDARLPEETSAYLASEDGARLVPELYRYLYATAIDPDSGTARDRSLRGIEVVVPLRLEAVIEPVIGGDPPTRWREFIGGALPLIHAVGAQRNRGLGRAVLSLEEAAP